MKSLKVFSILKIMYFSLKRVTIIAALKSGLETNFECVLVEVCPCPDLSQAPFNLAASGLGGHPRILDIGGVPYLVPLAQKEKLYDMKDYPKLTGFENDENCLIIGAGAAPWTFLERNAEMMPNLTINNGKVMCQKTHIARTHDKDETFELIALPESETKMSLLGNLFLSNGNILALLKTKQSNLYLSS